LLITAKIVTRKRLNITLYVHFFYCLYFGSFYKSYLLVDIDSFRNHKILDTR